jgi:hypothetical protein
VKLLENSRATFKESRAVNSVQRLEITAKNGVNSPRDVMAACAISNPTRASESNTALFASTDDTKLRQMVEYLKEENRILRSKLPTTLTLTAREKARLIRLGSAVGSAIRHLVTIVSYRTFCRWTAAVAGPPLKKKRTEQVRKPGRGVGPKRAMKAVRWAVCQELFVRCHRSEKRV